MDTRHICSLECRDARDVKRSLGEVQSLNVHIEGHYRRGSFISDDTGTVWWVDRGNVNPGWTKQGTKTVSVMLLRKVNARGHQQTVVPIPSRLWLARESA